MLYTFGQYIVNVQWSITDDRFLTIFKFGIRNAILFIAISLLAFVGSYAHLRGGQFTYLFQIYSLWCMRESLTARRRIIFVHGTGFP